MGGGKKSKTELDERLRRRILLSDIKPKHIYFHYSKKEHTFTEHISYLLDDLRKARVNITEDVQDYLEHGSLSKFYPPFLVNTLNLIFMRSNK